GDQRDQPTIRRRTSIHLQLRRFDYGCFRAKQSTLANMVISADVGVDRAGPGFFAHKFFVLKSLETAQATYPGTYAE
ncbi:hypothetical protein HK102_005067, partial [Quaeritorhiza haematococci]